LNYTNQMELKELYGTLKIYSRIKSIKLGPTRSVAMVPFYPVETGSELSR